MLRLKGNIIFKGRIITITGLHIGGKSDTLEIGGVDKYVIRDPSKNYPYIPGSSIKGKMRMLTELAEGKVKLDKGTGKPCDCGKCMVCHIFGISAEAGKSQGFGPTRLLVRDAYPTDETINMWRKLDTGLLFTDYKDENNIDRLTSAASPRSFERVVPGSEFNFELVYAVYDFDQVNDVDNLRYVFQALQLVEHSAIGGHGSRGYGKIKFKLADPLIFTIQDYQQGTAKIEEPEDTRLKDLKELQVEKIIGTVSQKFKD